MMPRWWIHGLMVVGVACGSADRHRQIVPDRDAGADASPVPSETHDAKAVEGSGGAGGRPDATGGGGASGIRDSSVGGARADGAIISDHCGDAVLDPPEECDDGNRNNYDSCTATCRHPVLAAGRDHTCALSGDTIRCWGRGEHGQLGDGTFYLVDPRGVAAPVTASASFLSVRLSSGQYHTCALLDDRSVRCWGLGQYGQLGDDTLRTASPNGSAVPVTASLTNVAELEAGGDNSCALLGDGTVRCWGFGIFGQLGDGAKQTSGTPVVVTSLSGVLQVTAGETLACALLSDRTVSCWGYAGDDLSAGTAIYNAAPVAVPALANVLEVSAGPNYACAILDGGQVWCWGEGNAGQLGNGARVDSKSPVQVESIQDAVQIAAGRLHGCALLKGGAIRCWGEGLSGQLGDGVRRDGFPSTVASPVTVSLPAAVEISLGGSHSCAVLLNGSIRCWGNNVYGQLGDGTFTSTLLPVRVSQ